MAFKCFTRRVWILGIETIRVLAHEEFIAPKYT